MKSKLFIFFYLLATCVYSQEIVGVVLDQKTKQPIHSVAIYLDNTTKGVITDVNGVFRFDYNESLKHLPLVISHLGYKKIVFENYKPNVSYTFLLEEEVNTLDEVILVTPSSKKSKHLYWTRERKLQEFKNEFLGTTPYGKSCRILNEDDIKLSYNSDTNQLIATSYTPIVIENAKLGYKLRYDLKTFHVNYSVFTPNEKNSKMTYNKESSYTAGTTFFSNIPEDTKRKIRRERKKAYHGSALHFMRSLATNTLEKEKFAIVDKTKDQNMEAYFKLKMLEVNGSKKTEVKIGDFKRLDIVYKSTRQSFIVFENPVFTIDGFGNHEPSTSIKFGGEMGRKRVGDILPLDFLLDN